MGSTVRETEATGEKEGTPRLTRDGVRFVHISQNSNTKKKMVCYNNAW